MISFRPAYQALAKAFGKPSPDIAAAAYDRWTIAPAIRRHVPPARFLPGQLDRVRGVAFGTADEVLDGLKGDYETREPETLGFHLRDVDLVDGVLYAPGASRHLRPRQVRTPFYMRPAETMSGALYESWVGNRWFGNWLSDDCLTYDLAERFGKPATTSARAIGHVARYERLLHINPRRIRSVHFDELTLFDDSSHNADKQRRAEQRRQRLTARLRPESHAGVFVLRGKDGARRVLRNERMVAETLHRKHGFQILDPASMSVDQLIAACAGAKVVAGVEGSHLAHGLIAMPPASVLMVIQPPDRVVAALKIVTDLQQQIFAFIVGEGTTDGFTVRPDEIDRTLDLALD